MLQKQSVIEFLNADLSSMIEMFNKITAELKSATKYEIRSHSKNYQITFEQGKSNWSYFYLKPERLNPNIHLIGQAMAEKWTEGMSEEEKNSVNPIEFAIEKLSEEFQYDSLQEESIDEFEEFQNIINGDDENQKAFAELSVARFFDQLAYADHKKSMTQLLYEFLKDGKSLSLKKAISIDPSARYLPAVREFIEKSSDRKKSEIFGHIDDAMDDYFLTNGKNKFPLTIFMLISTLDSMGLLDGLIILNIDDIWSIVESNNLQYTDNPDVILEKTYLKTLLNNYLKNKVKKSQINFDFLTN